jgi:hypothetical protein
MAADIPAARGGGAGKTRRERADTTGASGPTRKEHDMGTTEKQGQQGGQGQPGQPGHERDKDRQGQQQQEPGRNPQPGGGQGERSR